MIWFACKQCGAHHGRPESSIGSVVFCECGHGNTVPWDSTIEAPPTVPVQSPPPLPAPVLEPVTFDVGEPHTDDVPRERRPRRRRERREREKAYIDPKKCLNHQSVDMQDRCTDCGESFCQQCLVYVGGQPLCGPCKNYRMRKLHRMPRAPHLALLSLILACFTGPLAFCLFPMGRNTGFDYLALLALLPQTAALLLGLMAFRNSEDSAKGGGQAIALSGILMSLFLAFWTLFFSVYSSRWFA